MKEEYIRTLKSLISDFLRGKEDIIDREYYQKVWDWLETLNRNEFCYWGPDPSSFPEIKLNKILIVCNDHMMATGKFNLTKAGLEDVNSFADFKKLFYEHEEQH